MTKRPLASLLVSVTVVIILGVTMVPLFFLQEAPNGGQLIWNEKELYIFIGSRDLGWSFRNGFLWAIPAVVAGSPHNQRSSVIVIHYRDHTLEQRELANAEIGPYTVFENQIFYGAARRWNGSRFEPVGAEEQARYLSWWRTYDWSAPVHGGWRNQCCLLSTTELEAVFPIRVDGEELRLVVRRPSPDTGTIELRRASNVSSRLWFWSFDGGLKVLGQQAYDKRFTF